MDMTFVSKTDDEFVDAMGRIYLHDLPKDGSAADPTISFGLSVVSSLKRFPSPPARITAFIGSSL